MNVPDDTRIVDAIALYLGTKPEWSGADDLDVIADLIGEVRPHPGSTPVENYTATFLKEVGRGPQ